MAEEKQDNTQNTGAVNNSFTKGMNKDVNDTYSTGEIWRHARNAVNNSHDGQVGVIGNEPANLHCITLPYDLIGYIHLYGDQWALFTTDDTDSEIGVFDESQCTYRKVVNAKCLNFKKSNLITGAYRYRYDCQNIIYWDDGLNPTRTMSLDSPPWVETCTTVNECTTCVPTDVLDCEKLRLSSLIKQPCLELKKGSAPGTLENGSYQVCIAYLINGVKVSDYLGLTEVQPIWTWENTSGSLEVIVKDIDKTFDEFQLVIVSNINANTTAKIVNNYSTSSGTIYIDRIDSEAGTASIDDIVFRSEPIEKSDAMFVVNEYLLRSGIYSKYKFNYQPQANNIKTQWVSVEYPSNYYFKGGNNSGYMRDEVYSFFIRWVYNTGFKSESYHIPGRSATAADRQLLFNDDAYEAASGTQVETWQVDNTASIVSIATSTLPDGGRVIASGDMAFWESTEKYPDQNPTVWGNLCGKKIRHHKMPDETVGAQLHTYTQDGKFINILGVKFEGITHPVDFNGNPIADIVGYEILRGSREGNKTIIAKGLFNNMREYNIPLLTASSGVKGLFQNYPYNDLRSDPYLTEDFQYGDSFTGGSGSPDPISSKMSAYKKDIFSFHSADTTFKNPYLAINEIKIYGNAYGTSVGKFEVPYNHPKFKIFTDVTGTIGKIAGLMSKAAAVSKGVKITGTESLPTEFQFGPISKPPRFPGGGGDGAPGTSVAAQAVALLLWTLETAIWVAETATIIALANQLGNVQQQKLLDLFRELIPKRQFAAQYNSHGFYNKFISSASGERRRKIKNFTYVKPSVQVYDENYQINNVYRSQYIAIGIEKELKNPSIVDESRFLESEAGSIGVGTGKTISKPISSFYGAIKTPMPSQYGQLNYIKQLVISYCLENTLPVLGTTYNSSVYFGGDVYINRFTEKNSFFFFNTWLMNEPDEFEIDYTLYANIPYPRFWINSSIKNYNLLQSPHEYRVLDNRKSSLFWVKQGYFYLFNSGVRDFFVESEVNVAFRDWEDPIPKRHYDEYRFKDLYSMFRSDYIQFGNFYKYDYSMSISKLFNSHISWGNMLPADYDPQVSQSCYSYFPFRIIYSLPQNDISKVDAWRLFLVNNFKEFPSTLTAIKLVDRTGSLFLMNNASPLKFLGTEQLQLDGSNTKVTIGDGALFGDNNALQSIMNSDDSFEYGSAQNRYGVVSCTYGIFWVSRDQGKVFQYANGLTEISQNSMKWWLAKFLPSQILKYFPNYPHADNPVIGTGIQMMYDNVHELIYISKKDYIPKNSDLQYDENGFYSVIGTNTVLTCPAGYTLQGNTCVKNEPCCPQGYTLINNECVKIETAPAIPVGGTIQITPTPYHAYGILGTRLYDGPSISSTFTLLNPGNPFWNFNSSAPYTQAGQLNNGPVNRLAKWGLQLGTDGLPMNNYTNNWISGSLGLPPVDQWIGFTTCLNITKSTVYHIGVAGDNRYRISVDGVVVLESDSSSISNFNYLHIYPITISAGSHSITIEGYNNGELACFAVEIYDLNDLPSGQTPLQYLNNQTDYSNLESKIIFSTRTVDQFSSGNYVCPSGYTANTNGNCNQPECTKRTVIQTVPCTLPPTPVQTVVKQYCDFTNKDCWEDASWTISYDPKIKAWISFHDWIPTFMLPSKTHLMTVNHDSIWKHNIRCDLYTNYYGVDYPFEIEFLSNTGQVVTTTRSIEYLLEAYKFYNDCKDKFHVLDENFDQAIVYNSEQISGLLELEIKKKNDPLSLLSYPQIGTSSIKIQYSKEENKYRFNQFWDVTKDRGEFTGIAGPMFNLESNGYKYNINPAYVDYNKPILQRKKFRHYVNAIFLRRTKSGNIKFLFKLSNQKINQSFR